MSLSINFAAQDRRPPSDGRISVIPLQFQAALIAKTTVTVGTILAGGFGAYLGSKTSDDRQQAVNLTAELVKREVDFTCQACGITPPTLDELKNQIGSAFARTEAAVKDGADRSIEIIKQSNLLGRFWFSK
jgi:hypothetical protein